MSTYFAHSEEETVSLAKKIGGELKPRHILFLQGDLGAGKTTFVKGLASSFNREKNLVSSPTFQLLHIYEGAPPIFHFDLYRLKDSKEFIHLGFDELFEKDAIVCVEWPERIQDLAIQADTLITITHEGNEMRKIHVEKV